MSDINTDTLKAISLIAIVVSLVSVAISVASLILLLKLKVHL